MFPKFIYPLVKYFTPFNIFQYITLRTAYAAVTALLISFLLGPKVIEILRSVKAGQEVRIDGPQTHLVKSGTPTMGGVFIIISIVVSILLWQDLDNPFTWLSVFSLLGFGLIGFIDDSLKIFKRDSQGLRAGVKFYGQVVVSLCIALFLYFNGGATITQLYLPFVKQPVVDLSLFYIPFAVVLLLATTNAVNLTDGLDGLASGLIIMVGLAFAVLAYLTGRADFAEYLQIPFIPRAGELTVLALAMVGSCVGFLWFNAHPAEVMMGDTGSLALGGIIGVMALMIKKELLLIVIGGVFVIETLSVIIQVGYFKLTKKRVFLMAPLHHHYELKGWPESKVVIRFWILGGLFAILSLSTLKLQ